jgi:hypothetical protein
MTYQRLISDLEMLEATLRDVGKDRWAQQNEVLETPHPAGVTRRVPTVFCDRC